MVGTVVTKRKMSANAISASKYDAALDDLFPAKKTKGAPHNGKNSAINKILSTSFHLNDDYKISVRKIVTNIKTMPIIAAIM